MKKVIAMFFALLIISCSAPAAIVKTESERDDSETAEVALAFIILSCSIMFVYSKGQ